MSRLPRCLPAWPVLGALVALAAPAALRAQGDCLECHSSADNVGEERLVVQAEAWEATLHGAAGLACLDCHTGKSDFPHEADSPLAACADCHADSIEELDGSVHGGRAEGDPRKPDCASCHGPVHALRADDDPASPMHPTRLAETCGRCHADPELAAQSGLKLVQPIAAYTRSIHAQAVARGEHAATCIACHGNHDILPASNPGSRVYRTNVPRTCGRCHGAITAVYDESVHGRAALKGIGEAPVCIDCHGEHAILGPADKGSPVYATNVPKMTCGRCHGDLRVTSKFGMKADAVEAFEDSFHGLAGRSGNQTVANCASCHGVHDILPSSDPRSHIAPANLAKTCGTCHPGAGSSVTLGPVHVIPDERGSAQPAVYWVRIVYLWMIWLVVGGMFLHNFADFLRKARHPVERPYVPVAERRPRMSLGFRIAHAATLLTFFALVWSGFALKFPEAWWARPLVAWEEQLAVRGWLHRGAALAMLAAFLFHFVHVAVDRRARACILGMLPNRHDLRELGEKLAWLAGRRREMPQAPALGYAEKAEYLALLWGTLVMAVTGFVLWFENWTLAHLPGWAPNVATTIHYYEAILASLAILVWHLYFVIFDPVVYPMDTTWLTGREAPGRTLERSASTIEPGER